MKREEKESSTGSGEVGLRTTEVADWNQRYVHVFGEGSIVRQRAVHASSSNGSVFTKSEPPESGKWRGREDEQNGDYSKSTYEGFGQSGLRQINFELLLVA